MSGYYAANPHYAPDDYSEQREYLERCEANAGRYFASATKDQLAAYHRTIADLRGLQGPKYERAREAAERDWKATTAGAKALYEETLRELMQTGEVSEAMAYRWDELAVAQVMQAAE